MKNLKLLCVVLPLGIAGCVSPNPQKAFVGVNETVVERTGYQVRWARSHSDDREIAAAVNSLLQSNLTAQSAVAVALLHNRSLQAEFENIGISQAELAQASRLHNPTIAGSWRFPDRPPSGMNSEYGAAANFLDLLMLPARKKIAARQLEQTKLRVAAAVLQMAVDTQIAFYEMQALAAGAQRAALVTEVNEAAVDLAQRQFDAGNISQLELQAHRSQATESRIEMIQAQARVQAKRERLNRLLGLSGEQIHWQADESLPLLPAFESGLAGLESLAVTQRLELAIARSDADLLAAARKLKQKTRYLPGVEIGINTEREPDGQRLTGPTLSLEIPLFDQGQAELAGLAAKERQALKQYAALEVTVRSEVREAGNSVTAARATAELYATTLVPQRQQILRQTLLQYNAMQKSVYELLMAKEHEQKAAQGHNEAVRDYWIARAELERAVGGRLKVEPGPAPTNSQSQPTETHSHQHGEKSDPKGNNK